MMLLSYRILAGLGFCNKRGEFFVSGPGSAALGSHHLLCKCPDPLLPLELRSGVGHPHTWRKTWEQTGPPPSRRLPLHPSYASPAPGCLPSRRREPGGPVKGHPLRNVATISRCLTLHAQPRPPHCRCLPLPSSENMALTHFCSRSLPLLIAKLVATLPASVPAIFSSPVPAGLLSLPPRLR